MSMKNNEFLNELKDLSSNHDLTYKWKEFWFDNEEKYELAKSLVMVHKYDYKFDEPTMYIAVLVNE